MYEHPLLLKDMIRPTSCLAALIIYPDDIHMRMPVVMLLSVGTVKYPICVIKAKRRHSLLVLSADIVSIEVAFMTNLITKNSSCF